MGYVLFDEIASGGMASVHFGRLGGPVGFSRVVAIKRLHKHLAREEDFVTMFTDEARLAARIRHTNVIPTIDVVAGDEIFIVMEYIQGESLSRLIRAERARGRFIPMNYSLAIMAGTLHGLHAAHDATDERGEPLNIVHRDVSPQNVLVGSDGVPRVFDFGVAKAAGRLQNTRDGSLKGKIAYMSPEQLAGREVSRVSDVYSAGVMLWELLAARRLFDGDNEAAIIPKIMSSQIVPPSHMNPHVPPALDEITMCALQFDAARRFPSAKIMAQELERNGGLVSASELGDWVRELAHEAIAKRARRIHDIESRDISEVSSGVAMSGAHSTLAATTIPPTSHGGLRAPTTEPGSAGLGSAPSHGGGRQMFADPSSGISGGVSGGVSGVGPGMGSGMGSGMGPASRPFGAPPPVVSEHNTPSYQSVASGMPPRSGFIAPPELSTQGAMSLGEQPPRRRSGAVIALMLLGLLLVAGGGFAIWRYAPRKQVALGAPQGMAPSASGAIGTAPSAAPTATPSSPSAVPSAGASPLSPPSAAPSSAASAASAAASAASTAPAATSTGTAKKAGGSGTGNAGPAHTAHPPPPPPKDDCDPPFVIDADGHKSYKRNCLGQ
jgi:serine/threonine-protein kinase